MNNVKKTIGWADYTINPIKGLCPMACSYCYARRMYQRFYLRKDGTVNPTWGYTIREDVDVYGELEKIKPGSRVFVGSTMELFGPWVTPLMLSNLLNVCECYPKLTFIFLTKRPQDLPKAFDDNCWVGVSVTNWMQFSDALAYLMNIKAKVKFLSFEPLLEEIKLDLLQQMLFPNLNWIIIGQQTPVSAKTAPKIEWIREIVEAADKAGVKVFLKDSLKPLLVGYSALDLINNSCLFNHFDVEVEKQSARIKLRQEFPEVK